MLNQIVARKKIELEEAQAKKPLGHLLREIPEAPPPSFLEALRRDAVNIIAEIKFSSPSHGRFAIQWSPSEVARTYRDNGAAAISVLTDRDYFRGEPDYLRQVRQAVPEMPLLRKDFILDRHPVAEARVLGASAYLLIVACLTREKLAELVRFGQECGLCAMVEVHDPYELETAIEAGCRLIGINNRDLRTFRVDVETSFRLARRLEGEGGFTLVSESGIGESSQIAELRDAGFQAFLIGSSLMDSDDPGAMLRRLTGRKEGDEG